MTSIGALGKKHNGSKSLDPANALAASTLDYDQPELDIEQVHLQFDLENDLQTLLVQNNIMYIIKSAVIYRIDLGNPSDVSKVPIPSAPQTVLITNAWLNSKGETLIIQVNQTQYYHLHKSYKKPKILSRLKGFHITSIAFVTSPDNNATENILFTTKDAHVHVASIKYHDPESQENKRDDKLVKKVFQCDTTLLKIAFSETVGRLYLFSTSDVNIWDCLDHRLSSLVSTFQGPHQTIHVSQPNLTSVFFSETHYYYVDGESRQVFSNEWASTEKLTEFVRLEDYDVTGTEQKQVSSSHHLIFMAENSKKLVVVNKLLPNDMFSENISVSVNCDELVGITADHKESTFWLYSSSNIYELIIKNDSNSAWYAYYQMGQYKNALNALNSSNNVRNKVSKKQMISAKYGYELLQKGAFGIAIPEDMGDQFQSQLQSQMEGMRLLAQSSEPFEKVMLMIMSLNNNTSSESLESETLMLSYLQQKLDHSRDNEADGVKVTILASWIMGIHLRQLKKIDLALQNAKLGSMSKNGEALKAQKEKFDSVKKGAFSFVQKYLDIVDKLFVYDTIKKFNLSIQLMPIAEFFEDYDYAVNQYIEREYWEEALTMLARYYSAKPAASKPLIYSTSTVLLINAPKPTTDFWLRLSDLDYEKLLPSILFYNKREKAGRSSSDLSLRFLSKLIFEKNVMGSCISNYYLSLLIVNTPEGDKSQTHKIIHKTLDFMKKNFCDQRQLPYDPNFVLRTCLRYDLHESAVMILINDLGLYEEALNLSLEKGSISLAESVLQSFDSKLLLESNDDSQDTDGDFAAIDDTVNASRIKLEDERFTSKRKLWLIYAKFLIKSVAANRVIDIPGLNLGELNGNPEGDEVALLSSNLSKTLQYLFQLSNVMNKNAGILSLKDLLPFLPETIMISQFKNEIVESLNIYNNRINQLALEMQESAATAKKLRTQIADSITMESKGFLSTIIEPGESCHLCGKMLVSKNFLIFPNCQHAYHKDCAVRYYLQSKSDYRFKKIFRNFKRFSSLSDKQELDNLLMKECLLCNESLLNTLDDQLIDLTSGADDIFGT